MHVHMHKRVQNAALRVEKIIFLALYLTDALLWALTSKSRLSLSSWWKSNWSGSQHRWHSLVLVVSINAPFAAFLFRLSEIKRETNLILEESRKLYNLKIFCPQISWDCSSERLHPHSRYLRKNDHTIIEYSFFLFIICALWDKSHNNSGFSIFYFTYLLTS